MGLFGDLLDGLGKLVGEPRRSPQGWTDEVAAWPAGSRGAYYHPTPWDAVTKLEGEWAAFPWDGPATRRGAAEFLGRYLAILTHLSIFDLEMARRKGTYGRLVLLLEDHLTVQPMIAAVESLNRQIRFLAEDLEDSKDADLGALGRRLEAHLKKARDVVEAEVAEAVAHAGSFAPDRVPAPAGAGEVVPSSPPTEPLTREGLFALLCDEVFRDGELEEWERTALQKMAGFLKLAPEAAKKLARRAKERYKEGVLGEARPLDPKVLYVQALRLAHSDAVLEREEEAMLEGLRKLFCISDDDHEAMLAEALRPSAEEMLRCHEVETSLWDGIGAGSGPAKEAWGRVLAALMSREVRALDGACRLLEDAVDAQFGGQGSGGTALRLLPIMRCLLPTSSGTFSPWVGEGSHDIVARTLVNVLLTLHGRPLDDGARRALDLGLVGLWLDMTHLVRFRRVPPLRNLLMVLEVACLVGADLEGCHRGAAVVDAVGRSWPVLDDEMQGVLEGGLRAFCSKLPPNNPLSVASDRVLRAWRPEAVVLPGPCPHGPKAPVPSSSPFRGRLHAVTTRLAQESAELASIGEVFAGSASDEARAAVADVFAAARKVADRDGVGPWEIVSDIWLSAIVVPRPAGRSRPLIGLVGAGGRDDLRVDFKAARIELKVARAEDGSLCIVVHRPALGKDEPLFPPIEPSVAAAFAEALEASRGAYDVVLADADFRPWRIWSQVGDLDPSGDVLAGENLLGQSKFVEAAAACARATERYPWLSRGLVNQGLAAKHQGDRASARRLFEEALARQPGDSVTLARLGVLAKQEGNLSLSQDFLMRALSSDPTDQTVLPTLASVVLNRGMTEGEAAARRGIRTFMYLTAALHAHRPGGEAFRAFEAGLASSGLEPTMLRHVGIFPVDPDYYG